MNILRIFCNLRSCGYDHTVITENSDIAMLRCNFATQDLRCNEGFQVRLIGVARGGGTGAMPPPIHSGQKQGSWQSRRQGGPGGSSLPINMLGPPIKKLTLLKTAAFALNFKLWPPSDERLAPLSRLLCCRLWILVIGINYCHCVLFSCWDFNKWAYIGEIQLCFLRWPEL